MCSRYQSKAKCCDSKTAPSNAFKIMAPYDNPRFRLFSVWLIMNFVFFKNKAYMEIRFECRCVCNGSIREQNQNLLFIIIIFNKVHRIRFNVRRKDNALAVPTFHGFDFWFWLWLWLISNFKLWFLFNNRELYVDVAQLEKETVQVWFFFYFFKISIF